MPQARIPFVPDQQSGWSARGGASPAAVNVTIDGRGVVRRRPGITSLGNLTTPAGASNTTDVVGVHITLDGSVYAVDSTVPGRLIFRRAPGSTSWDHMSIGSAGGPPPLVPLAEMSLPGTLRPTFAETEAMLVIAGGREPRKVLFDPLGVSPLGGNPPDASHIVGNSSRLIANEMVDVASRSRFFYSSQALGSSTTGHETWSGAGTGFITAEARPDKIVAIHESTNEIFVFGQTTLQVYAPDAFFVYSALPTRDHGAAGSYSVIAFDQSFAWLDHRRRFVTSDGRGIQYIGEPIQATIDDIPDVSDVFGYRVRMGNTDCLVWTFPSDGRTFAYQVGGGWAEWMGWDGNWTKFIVTSHALAGSTNVVGLTQGRIGILSQTIQTDLGSSIRAYVETGYQDHDTDRRKHCTSVRLALKRGEVTGATSPVAWLKWRDRPGEWEGRIQVQLGASGDSEITTTFRSLGVYRRRQWMFEFTGSDDLELVSATEEFNVLDN